MSVYYYNNVSIEISSRHFTEKMHYTQENCIRGGKSHLPHSKMGYEIIVALILGYFLMTRE